MAASQDGVSETARCQHVSVVMFCRARVGSCISECRGPNLGTYAARPCRAISVTSARVWIERTNARDHRRVALGVAPTGNTTLIAKAPRLDMTKGLMGGRRIRNCRREEIFLDLFRMFLRHSCEFRELGD